MGRILIVDDEPNIRDSISLALRRNGHETLTAGNSSDALALAEEQVPDLIISDICMEGGDGFSLLRQLRTNARTGAIPFIIITGSPNHDGMLEGVENAADGYLPKPVSLQLLIAAVRNRLQREELIRRDANEIRAQLYRVLEASPDLIGILHPQTLSIIFLNDAGTKLFQNEGHPSDLTRYFSPAAAENFERFAIPAAVKNGSWVGETVLVTPSERRIPVEMVLQSHRHHDGKVEYFSIIARDLTERTENERALRASEYRFRCLVDALPDAVLMYNSNGQTTFCNARASQLLGYSAHELLTSPISAVFKGPPPPKSQSDTTFLRHAQLTVEHTVFRKNGESLPVSIFREDLNVEGEQVELCILHDLTERKIIERERQAIEVQLRQAQKLESIGQLAAGIAHEINTPTQYIGDNTRFLKEAFSSFAAILQLYQDFVTSAAEVSALLPRIKDLGTAVEKHDLTYLLQEVPTALEQSLDGIGRVSKIVGAMKDFSHPNSTEKSSIDINQAIESTITVARNEWKYVAVLETDLDPKLPLVPCLPGEFNQVILNLVVNAAHAIGDTVKGTDAKGTIRVSTKKLGNTIEIRISDTGTGIPEKVQSRIFEPFFTTKEVGKGTGQGLAISRSVIVDKHGGTISFETETGKGTTFIIRLPLNVAA